MKTLSLENFVLCNVHVHVYIGCYQLYGVLVARENVNSTTLVELLLAKHEGIQQCIQSYHQMSLGKLLVSGHKEDITPHLAEVDWYC